YFLCPAMSPALSLAVAAGVYDTALDTTLGPYLLLSLSIVFSSASSRCLSNSSINKLSCLALSGTKLFKVTLNVRYFACLSHNCSAKLQITLYISIVKFVPSFKVYCLLTPPSPLYPIEKDIVLTNKSLDLKRIATSSTNSNNTTFVS